MSIARFPSKWHVRRLEDEDDEEWNQYGSDPSAGEEEDERSYESENPEDISPGRTRGANQGTNVAVDANGRTILEWAKKKFITASASRAISATMKAYLGGPYWSFSKIPDDRKKLLWGKFKNKYTWPRTMDAEVKEIWMSASKTRLHQTFSDARKDARKKIRSENPIDWKGHGPSWLDSEYWNEIIDKKYSTEDWLKSSKSGRKNRLTLKARTITKHTCGSITIVAHEHRLSKKLGRQATATEVFKRAHKKTKGEGDFVDNKSKLVCETYEHSVEAKHGLEISTHPVIDVELWCEASQGPSKGGVLYGLGATLSAISTNRTTTRDDNDGDTSLKEQLNNACEKIDVLQKEKEDMRQELEEMKREEERKDKEFEQQMEAKRLKDEMKPAEFERMILSKIDGARGLF